LSNPFIAEAVSTGVGVVSNRWVVVEGGRHQARVGDAAARRLAVRVVVRPPRQRHAGDRREVRAGERGRDGDDGCRRPRLGDRDRPALEGVFGDGLGGSVVREERAHDLRRVEATPAAESDEDVGVGRERRPCAVEGSSEVLVGSRPREHADESLADPVANRLDHRGRRADGRPADDERAPQSPAFERGPDPGDRAALTDDPPRRELGLELELGPASVVAHSSEDGRFRC
jgi:hypothetical protein